MAADNEVGIEFDTIDFTRVLRDADAIGRVNPHRYELKLLTAVVYADETRHLIVGYADFAADAFWVRGHFPEFPVVPGVLMCEAAAQLVNFYTVGFGKVPGDKLMGLGGLEDVRFRGMVRPGERLVVAARGLRVSSRITKFIVAGAVPRGGKFDPAFEALVIGVPLGKLEDLARA